jgi:FdhD protein
MSALSGETSARTGAGAARVQAQALRDGRLHASQEWVAEEVAIALEVNGLSHAVMMATPLDLEDFALGFMLSEGLIETRGELLDVEVEPSEAGITLHMRVLQRQMHRLKERRRTLAGRTGCGLCGTESLDQAIRPICATVARCDVPASAIAHAMNGLAAMQDLQRTTGATHAAAWCDLDGVVRYLREDVGRHNALDKLVGAMARAGEDSARGFIAVTSRASYEMVHKTATAGVGLLAAISAPTRLAIDTAQRAGLTLAGFARGRNAVLYTRPARMLLPALPDGVACET